MASTRNATSPGYVDVNCAVNGTGCVNGEGWSTPMSDGDTVVVPPGVSSWTWSQRLIVNAGITLIGAGIDQTIILDNTTAHQIIEFITTLGARPRLSGFTFTGGSDTSVLHSGGVIFIGYSQSIRIDHCKFNKLNNEFIIRGWQYGVVDHCQFIEVLNTYHGVIVWHENWNNKTWGDGSWADDSQIGTSKSIFIEDNTFTGAGTAGDVDSYNGAHITYRHNTTDGYLPSHGTESGGRLRGVRTMEAYNNRIPSTVQGGNWAFTFYLRSGTGVFFNNIASGSTHIGEAACDRLLKSFTPWGQADGANAWDVNDTADHTGNGLGGSTGGIFATGTATTNASSGTFTVTHAGTWTTNQWAGYTIRNLTQTGWAGKILSNTDTTITYAPGNTGTYAVFSSGNSVEIRYVQKALDQPGMGKGDLVTGDITPINSTTGTSVWPNEATEPIYQWSNKLNGVSNPIFGNIDVQEGTVIQENTVMPGYPVISSPGAAQLRIGADSDGSAVTATQAWGYTYPHPLAIGNIAPLITSASSISFGTGVSTCFDVTSTGTPTSTLTESGSLPSGVTYTQGTNCAGQSVGTSAGKLEGNPSTTIGSPWSITFNATNGTSPDAAQSFTLTISTPASKICSILVTPGFTSSYQQQTIFYGQFYQSSILFKNIGNTTATGISVSNSNDEYTVPNQPTSTLLSGQTASVVIAFNPRLGVGSHDNTITINGDWTSGTNTAAVTSNPVQPPANKRRKFGDRRSAYK